MRFLGLNAMEFGLFSNIDYECVTRRWRCCAGAQAGALHRVPGQGPLDPQPGIGATPPDLAQYLS